VQGMMSYSPHDGYRGHDLARLRREWVAAYRAWTQVAEDKALTSSRLTDEQRAVLRRYRAAETANFTHLYMTTDTQPANRDH
jgi:hypothetical protein